MVESSKYKTSRGKTKLLFFALLPAAFLLGAAELFSSLSMDRSIEVTNDPTTGRRYYAMRIGRLPWGRKSVTPLNSLGFPDEEFVNVLPKGDCVHVIFSGDSFVFGDGVDRDMSFFQLIKQWTARNNSDHCIRLFNIGERATTIEQQSQRIHETLHLLEPDIVILGQYQNDLSDLTKPGFVAHKTAESRWKDVRLRLQIFDLAVVRYLSYHAFAFMIKNGIRHDVLRHWSVLEDPGSREIREKLKGTYREMYRTLVVELRQRNVEFGVVILPSKFDLLAGRFPEEAFFVGLAQEQNVPYLSLMPTLESNRSTYPYLLYDGHLNEHGNQVVAKAVIKWLFESKPPPFRKLTR